MRIVPYMLLFTTMKMMGRLYWTAVASSIELMRKQPSPAKHTTVRFGCTTFAAMAAGTP